MDKANILFVSPARNIGGGERVLIQMAQYLRGSQFDPLVVVPHEGELKDELVSRGVKVIVTPVEWLIHPRSVHARWHLRAFFEGLPKRVEGIARIIREENVALVHSNLGLAIDGAVAATLTGRPHIWHHHSTFRRDPTFRTWVPYALMSHIYFALSDALLCCSTSVAKELFPRHLRRKVMVFYNGVDVAHLTPDPPQRDLRVELGLSPATPLVGLLGTFVQIKGQLDFVEAAARVRRVIPGAHFVCAGYPGSNLKTVLQRIDDLHASDYIHYLGYRRDSADIMRSLDVYVLASWLEGMGLVILEAMACGKPVVATRCGGPTESVLDNVTGILVDVHNIDPLAGAIINLLSRPDRGASLGARGRERVTALFDQRQCLANLPKIYQQILTRTMNTRQVHYRIHAARHLISLFFKLCTLAPIVYEAGRQIPRQLGLLRLPRKGSR